ncbi:MAG: phosphoribosylaminoimidazole-succinocarboxamide synthase [Blastocatellia bacterium]|jgi:phosphoribosylaminoimidazole-succinocarboxamide synthase|nr:phosphoribosylaminoimidazole-succinocarboxamide synthase [Blastocatellia bacterium]
MASSAPVLETTFNDLKLVRRGKVRDVYAVDEDRLLIVATDRISAFDSVSPTPIERKGEVLTSLSRFWFNKLGHIVPNHLLTTNVDEMPDAVRGHASELRGRTMLVRSTEVFPVECVVRGYLSGSGWKDYQRTGQVCGHQLPAGLRDSEKLAAPIFTPATKAETGHDENISEQQMAAIVGAEVTAFLRDVSLRIYQEASEYARSRGIIIADTKFEFGRDRDGQIILIDEVLTPDSSRFWPLDDYEVGKSQASFDKQYVRDYLESINWDKQPPAPTLPLEVAKATTARYLEAYELLVGEKL